MSDETSTRLYLLVNAQPVSRTCLTGPDAYVSRLCCYANLCATGRTLARSAAIRHAAGLVEPVRRAPLALLPLGMARPSSSLAIYRDYRPR